MVHTEACKAHRHDVIIALVERHNCAAVEASVHIALDRIAHCKAQRQHLSLPPIALQLRRHKGRLGRD